MRLWIDDERDPKDYLIDDQNEIKWIREPFEAQKTIFIEYAKEIIDLHLDQHLGSSKIKGSDILHKVFYRLKTFQSLKRIYLHSSDDQVVKKLILEYQEKFKQENIELIDAPYRDHD